MSAPGTDPSPTSTRRPDRLQLRKRWRRVRDSTSAVAQIVVATTAAYAVCVFVLGHQAPLLAITVTISGLGLVRDARPGRLLETLLGMLTGIAVAELLRLGFGTGWWQLAIALALTLLVSRFLAGPPGFAIAAAIQSGIVMVVPGEAPFTRLADAAVGALAALAVTALIPRSARRLEVRDGVRMFAAAEAAVGSLVQALRRGDRVRAERGLERARSVQALLDDWRASLDSARAIARISPFLRRQRADLARHARVLAAADLATRNIRVVGRRVVYLADERLARPAAADLLAEIGRGLGMIARGLDDVYLEPISRELLRAVAARLDPAAAAPAGTVGEQNLVAALRPLVVDLLVAAGEDPESARAALPRI